MDGQIQIIVWLSHATLGMAPRIPCRTQLTIWEKSGTRVWMQVFVSFFHESVLSLQIGALPFIKNNHNYRNTILLDFHNHHADAILSNTKCAKQTLMSFWPRLYQVMDMFTRQTIRKTCFSAVINDSVFTIKFLWEIYRHWNYQSPNGFNEIEHFFPYQSLLHANSNTTVVYFITIV